MNWPHYDSGFAKIFCGGSWEADGEGAVRVTQHTRNTPSVQDTDVGFRCARAGARRLRLAKTLSRRSARRILDRTVREEGDS